MPTAQRQAGTKRASYEFTLVLSGVRLLDERVEQAVFEAGCDDALLGMRDGVPFLEFDREAGSLPEVVLAAIQQVECIKGIGVIRVEPDDLVTAAEMARRTGRSRESIRQLATGLRGPGDFPPPVHGLRGRSPLWRWAEAAAWMHAYDPDWTGGRVEVEAASFIAVLNGALRIHPLIPSVSTMQALWKTMGRWRGRPRPTTPAWARLIRDAAEQT